MALYTTQQNSVCGVILYDFETTVNLSRWKLPNQVENPFNVKHKTILPICYQKHHERSNNHMKHLKDTRQV